MNAARSHHRRWAGRSDLRAIVAVVLLCSVFPVDLLPGDTHARRGGDGQYSAKQGQVLAVAMPMPGGATGASGRFLGRSVYFFPAAGQYVGLLGVDLQDPPGTHELTVDVMAAGGNKQLSYNVLVLKEKFPVQYLTLPKDQVDLDEESLVRVKAEQQQVSQLFQLVTQDRFWSGPFLEPVQGPTTGAFGRRRVINGQARNPHNGEDISAPAGTDVVAMNHGVVRLATDQYFAGKGVYIDHGWGLFSMYFHLSEISVVEGQAVERGQVIGKVGATGRASGPHLHWGVRLNGARVNPLSLVALPVDRVRSAAQDVSRAHE
jgi:hypothetical protein